MAVTLSAEVVVLRRTVRGALWLVLLTSVLGVGCDEKCTLTAPLCDIRTVSVEPGSVVLTALAQEMQLAVIARDADSLQVPLDSVKLVWSSSAPTIVSVDSTGRIRAESAGEAVIRVVASALDEPVREALVLVDPAALPSQLAIGQQPAGASLGAAFTVQPVIQIRDDRGQVIAADLPVTASLASGPGTLSGTLTVTPVSGIATFTDLRVAGSSGTHTLRFTAPSVGPVVTVPFAVTDAQLQPDSVHFASDWRTATGTSVAAIRDGGKWPSWNWGADCPTNPSNCSVKIIDDPEFPSGRAFWSGYHGNRSSTGGSMTGSGTLIVDAPDNKWPLPNVGQTIFHRFYLKNAVNAPRFGRNLGRGSHHPVEGWGDDPVLGGNCAFHWEYRFDALANGTYTWEIANLRDRGSWNRSGLLLGRVYLMEVAYTRTATSRWTVRARLDGVDQGQIFSGDAEIGAYCLRSLFVGNNDPWGSGDNDASRWRNVNGSPVPGGPYGDLDAMLWGAFAVAVRDSPNQWIGPYDLTRGW